MGNKKNILFFFTDEQRKDTLGCYGNKICKTPNIDRLANEGICFDRGYTPSAICTPARASLVTGLMPHHHNLLANHERNVGFQTELDESKVPFSTYLREAGYNVGTVGKWHVGEIKGPNDHGFDGIFYPGWGETLHHEDYIKYLDEHNLPHFKAHSEISGVFPNGQPGPVLGGILEQPEEATFTYYLAEKTIEQLRNYAEEYKNTGKPFYLSLNIFGPHLPYYLPEEYAKMYDPEDIVLPESFKETFKNKPMVLQNYSKYWCVDDFDERHWKEILAMYWGFVTLIDKQIGRVLAEAEKLGLMDDTMVVFSTDHGSFEGSHRLNDKGPAMYEDIYNIPYIIKYPGLKEKGKVDKHFVSLIDLTATFVDMASGKVPEHFDGRSLLPILEGKEVSDWRKEMITEFHGHHFPYPQRMIRSDRYKLIVSPGDINEFYDLEKDPCELTNEINNPEYKDIIDQHYSKLYKKLKASDDRFYHWLGAMFNVGVEVGDASLGQYHEEKDK